MTSRQRRFLVAVDGSAPSLQAARLAIETAREVNAVVRIVSVVVNHVAHRLVNDASTNHAPARERAEAGMRDAATYVEGLGVRAGVQVDCIVVPAKDRPYEAIIGAQAEWDADFIFMGRTSRTGPGRALLGSQTEHVLEFADVPVIVVPGSVRT